MPTDLGSSPSGYRHSDAEAADPGADQKRRARWRLLGALIFSLIVASTASQLMLQEPRPLAQDFVVLMPVRDLAPEARSSYAGTPQAAEDSEGSGTAGTPSSVPLSAERHETPPVVAVTTDSAASGATDAKGQSRAAGAANPGGSRAWFVQLGAYESQDAAANMAAKVRGLGYNAVVQSAPSPQGMRYRVRVGPFNEAQAKAYQERARAQGYAPFLIRP